MLCFCIFATQRPYIGSEKFDLFTVHPSPRNVFRELHFHQILQLRLAGDSLLLS